jgi:hypothetical protein
MPLAVGRLPFWHSLAFSMSERTSRALIAQAMARRPSDYYYVTHPLDLLDPETDFQGPRFSYLRSNITLAAKKKVWQSIMASFSNVQIVAQRDLIPA